MTSNKSGRAKDAILVLGMHRSGTSSIAGTVVKLGAKPPKTLLDASPTNERGHWESIALMRVNDEILKSAGTSWDDWRMFNTAWYRSPMADEFGQKAVAELITEFGDAPLIVVKDPRMCRLMPFWNRAFKDGRYKIRAIIPLRSPVEVSRSLWIRDRIPVSKGILMWLRHLLDAEFATRKLPRAVIDWSKFIGDWRSVMIHVGEELGLSWPLLSDAAAAEIDRFLDPHLRHHISDIGEWAALSKVNDWAQPTYRALIALAVDPFSSDAHRTLDDIRHEFNKASSIFGRVVVDLEEDLSKAHRDRDNVISEKEMGVAEHVRYQEDMKGQWTRVITELAGYTTRITELTAERDDLHSQLEGAVSQWEQSSTELRDQTRRTNELTAERDAFQSQLEFAASEVELLKSELSNYVTRTNDITAERDALRAQFMLAITELEGLRTALAAEVARACGLAAERDALTLRVHTATVDLGRYASEAAENETRVAELVESQRVLQQRLESEVTKLKQIREGSLLSLLLRFHRNDWE